LANKQFELRHWDMSGQRLLIIGLDAMDSQLVRRWAAAGFLPGFRKLFESAAWTEYTHPPEYSSGTIWPSVNTGVSPLRHGFYSLFRFCEGTYHLRLGRADDVRSDPFWQWFAGRGKRIVIADVPFAIPKSEFGGKQFWGWNQHDNWAWRKSSVPADLLSGLCREFGPPLARSCKDYPIRTHPLLKLKQGLLEAIRRRTGMLKSLLLLPDWDLFYAAYPETHCAGHRMWHLDDLSHPQHSQEQLSVVGHGLREVYQAIDHSLSELLKCTDESVTRLIFLSHGMGPNFHAAHLFPEFLARFNRSWEEKMFRQFGGYARDGWFESIWRKSVWKLPVQWRNRLKYLFPVRMREWITLQRAQASRQWSRELSFSLPKDGFSAVRVNLVNREPKGRIQPGGEYHGYMGSLLAELAQLTNAESGQPVVGRIFRVDEQMDPARIGGCSDLVVWWNKQRTIDTIHSPTLGLIGGPQSGDHTGEHVMRGAVILSHPKAELGEHAVPGMTILDVTATICELGGIRPASDIGGNSRCSQLLSEAPHDRS
jgi:predicted AlkP superfamily phosphohydrolase/phosphomutase